MYSQLTCLKTNESEYSKVLRKVFSADFSYFKGSRQPVCIGRLVSNFESLAVFCSSYFNMWKSERSNLILKQLSFFVHSFNIALFDRPSIFRGHLVVNCLLRICIEKLNNGRYDVIYEESRWKVLDHRCSSGELSEKIRPGSAEQKG